MLKAEEEELAAKKQAKKDARVNAAREAEAKKQALIDARQAAIDAEENAKKKEI